MKLAKSTIREITNILHDEVQFFNCRGNKANGAVLYYVEQALMRRCLAKPRKRKRK